MSMLPWSMISLFLTSTKRLNSVHALKLACGSSPVSEFNTTSTPLLDVFTSKSSRNDGFLERKI